METARKLFIRSVAIVALVLLPIVAWADSLEVRRSANVYEEPSRHSEVIAHINPAEREGPYLIRLLEDEKVNGYYHINVSGKGEGWIYKTLVRRVSGQHPDYVPYKRSLYPHWIDEDGDCQNTRHEVLIRDASGPLGYEEPDECMVASGTWLDPYTGRTFHNPGKLDVDHVVPLKNAHESGAWAWSRERRREYANYLMDANHLLAVSASENRKKGAKGPDLYLPPLESYQCDYVQIWVQIKEDWELEMTESEGEAVEEILAGCP